MFLKSVLVSALSLGQTIRKVIGGGGGGARANKIIIEGKKDKRKAQKSIHAPTKKNVIVL